MKNWFKKIAKNIFFSSFFFNKNLFRVIFEKQMNVHRGGRTAVLELADIAY
jgi:hypothetical protein